MVKEVVNMHHRFHSGFHERGHAGFTFDFSPSGFRCHRGRPFPRRAEYLKMLEEYRDHLKGELEEVEEEIADLKKES